MEWKEQLPEISCPPETAFAISGTFARLIPSADIDDNFCASWSARGKAMSKRIDPCIWAACSIVAYDVTWSHGPLARIRDFADNAGLLKYNPFVALLDIKEDHGLAYRGNEESPHFSFWMYKEFNPRAAVIGIESLI